MQKERGTGNLEWEDGKNQKMGGKDSVFPYV